MVNGILGKKLGMTQVFNAGRDVVPVTVLQAGPCVVVQCKTQAKDGYEAAQLALVEAKAVRGATKAIRGHFGKAGAVPMKFVREVRLSEGGETKAGDSVSVDLFRPKDLIDVIGTSKGHGFAGLVKRHHFRGGAATNGSMFHRAPGSIGASSFPSRVWKGMRMGGQMGNSRVTVRNLEIVQVDAEKNLLFVKGAVPGPKGGYLIIEKAGS